MATKRALRRQLEDSRSQVARLIDQREDASTSGAWIVDHLASSQADLVITRTRERDSARRDLRATEIQLGEARRENTLRLGKQIEYSNRAVANMRRLARAVRACARYRAELADEQGAHALTASHFTDFSEDWEHESGALKSRLSTAEQARAALVDQIEELRKCNDDLSREAVNRAGNLSKGAHE